MRRVETILTSRREPEALRHKPGPRRQRRRRRAERTTRISALVFTRWARRHGLTVAQAAHRLGMDASTLRSWQDRWTEDRLPPRERGRPSDRVDRDHLWSVLAVFGLIGPHVGLPTLQNLFPDMARSALISLQARCRAIYRRKAAWVVYALRWTTPGTVWAIDFAEPPQPIEGLYTHLLLVRDLPSGFILMAIPTYGQSTTVVVHILASLFRWFGAPLVIKMDNGGPFITDEVKDLLREHGVLPLYSPPGTPSYNGAIEAGVGSIKHRAVLKAALADRPGDWTSDDIEGAVRDANTNGRPRGAAAPSPQEAWQDRVPVTEAQRSGFHNTYTRHAEEEYARRGLLPMAQLQHHEQASIDRAAISRALIGLGFLLIRRRRITPPISRLRKRKIS
jgi:transposase InsO family protein